MKNARISLMSFILMLSVMVSGNSYGKPRSSLPRQRSYTPKSYSASYHYKNVSRYSTGAKSSPTSIRSRSTYQPKNHPSKKPSFSSPAVKPKAAFSYPQRSYQSKTGKISIAPNNYRSPKTYQTKHSLGQSYENGMPKVDRNEAAKREFLKERGLDRVPPGYQVDHMIPLSKGGQDTPANMQLLPTSVHQQKTANEKRY